MPCKIKTKWKSQFSFILFNYVRHPAWMFLVSKVDPLTVDLVNYNINDNNISRKKLFSYCDEQKKFSCKLKSNKVMNKKESWIIDNKYFNCESMTPTYLKRKANITKLIRNKITKELHLRKIKTANFSMAVLWLTQFMIVTLNILLGILFVLANKDFCGSVFETQVGE